MAKTKFNKHTNYPSLYAIGDRVLYTLENSSTQGYGSIIAIKFTPAKVFYYIVDDYDAKTYKLDSIFVLNRL